MHFTFLYDGAAQRTAEYPTLEEAVRSIELGAGGSHALEHSIHRSRGRNSGLPISHGPRESVVNDERAVLNTAVLTSNRPAFNTLSCTR